MPESLGHDEVELAKGWSEPEKWAWDEVRAGRSADFNARYKLEPDPRTPEGWDGRRRLRASFLKEILFREPHRSDIPVEGVRIVGTLFPEAVDLSFGRLNSQLWLDNCRFEKEVNLTGLRMVLSGLAPAYQM